ncbi:MAG: menaquinone biosynthesis protein [Phycisphaerae bacterium]
MPDNVTTDSGKVRVGAVSFLNALPLIEGLEDNARVVLTRTVPSRLAGMLDRGEVDVALVPVIDCMPPGRDWSIVSDACIACDGATLTVRVFSRFDPDDVDTLHVDCDSRSSVVLASVIWREKYGRALKVLPFQAAQPSPAILANCQAVLLIGDKVIQPPVGLEVFSTQIDLGAAWKSLTGLPFVFAAWVASSRAVGDRVAGILAEARDAGVARAPQIAEEHAPHMGWPVDLARRYLTEYLSFTLTDRHREGMQRFVELAKRYELVSTAEEPVSA